MAASDEAQRNRIWNGVERDPDAHVVHAIDSVIRIVVVPWSDFFGLGFLDEYMLVKHACSGGAHEVERSFGNAAVHANFSKLWNAVPVHIVIKKSASGANRGVFICPGARACHIGCNALAQCF